MPSLYRLTSRRIRSIAPAALFIALASGPGFADWTPGLSARPMELKAPAHEVPSGQPPVEAPIAFTTVGGSITAAARHHSGDYFVGRGAYLKRVRASGPDLVAVASSAELPGQCVRCRLPVQEASPTRLAPRRD